MFILCQGDLAKEPYIIPISEVPVYSLEELCYYMYHNIYTVTEGFFDENLVHWLKGQVHLRTLAMKMEKLIRKHHNIKDLVVTLLCACDYYKKEEIFSLVEVMEKIANLPPEKKARMKADNYLKAGRYGRSFQEYQSLLHGPLAKELSTKEYGDVLHDQAIAMFHVSSFRQAADGFKEAYARNHRPESLQQYLYAEGQQVLGSFGMLFHPFPVLIKLIDAAQPLSIQVHPSNFYAINHEHQYGKTEMWYVVDAEPGAFLYYGFRQQITREEFARRIEDNTLPEVLNAVPVCKGDCFYIPSGTVHAIGKGILIAEVQQNSDVTYRVYDYDRRDATGKPRQLHTEQAEDVAKRTPPRDDYNFGGHLIRCEYFTVDRMTGSFTDVCDDESFTSLVILDGNGTLIGENEKMPLQKGDSFFLPANSGSYRVEGNTVILKTRVGTI